MAKVKQYLKETKAEMRHVSWPTRTQSVAYTILVIIISLVTAAYLGALDFIFTEILKIFI